MCQISCQMFSVYPSMPISMLDGVIIVLIQCIYCVSLKQSLYFQSAVSQALYVQKQNNYEKLLAFATSYKHK